MLPSLFFTFRKGGGRLTASAPIRLEVHPFERHFTPKELAEIWRLDETTIRRIFQDQPGVLKIGKANRRDGKREYVTLRIPESVAARIYRERCG